MRTFSDVWTLPGDASQDSASVLEHAIGEELLRTWRQREASEHLAAAQKEVDLATDDTIFQRLEVADDHLQKIPTDTPERPLADSLQKRVAASRSAAAAERCSVCHQGTSLRNSPPPPIWPTFRRTPHFRPQR